MPPVDASRPGRRGVVVGLLGLGVAGLGGCGIRLEDDAPRVPLVPTRTPVAGEELLAALTRESTVLARTAEDVAGSLAAAVALAHRRQATVLRATLRRRQVPAEDLQPPTPSPSPTASAPTAPSPSGAVADAAALGAAEAAALATAARATEVPEDLVGAVVALHAQRLAAATLLTGTPPDGVPDPLDGEVVADLVRAVDAADYLVQVAAARSVGTRRERAVGTLDALRVLRAGLVAGGEDPARAIGHPLPFAVRTGRDVDRLVRESLTALRGTLATAGPELVTEHDGPGAAAAARWLGAAEVQAHRWGLRLEPFPGLS